MATLGDVFRTGRDVITEYQSKQAAEAERKKKEEFAMLDALIKGQQLQQGATDLETSKLANEQGRFKLSEAQRTAGREQAATTAAGAMATDKFISDTLSQPGAAPNSTAPAPINIPGQYGKTLADFQKKTPLEMAASYVGPYQDTVAGGAVIEPLRKEQAAKDKAIQDEKLKTADDVRQAARDAETARHNKAMEEKSRGDATESARQQQAALKAAEFDTKTSEMIGAVQEGRLLMENLVNTFKGSGFGGVGSMAGEGAAKIPVIGKYVAGKNKEYQNQKRVAAETWLRAATGAAAPDKEVATYTGFLPDESDPPQVAQKKTDNFFNKIAAKADGKAKVLELEAEALQKRGMTDLASMKYTQAQSIRDMITESRDAIPKIYEESVKGQSVPQSDAVTKSIAKARAGDKRFQDALTKKGIKWQ